MSRRLAALSGLSILFLVPATATAQDVTAPGGTVPPARTLTPVQMFDLADQLAKAGRTDEAIALLEALATNPDTDFRNEARFRLSQLLVADGRTAEAVAYLEAILAERPEAAPARLALARLQAEQGEFAKARRSLDAARAAGLPDRIEAAVDQYRAALRSYRPFGVSVNLGLAADSNINRATSSDVLGTIIGDFTLDEDAQETSGTGLSVGVAAFARLPMEPGLGLLARLNASGDFYGRSQFNDVSVGASVGPEVAWKGGRLQLGASASARWFGGVPLSREWGGDARLSFPIRPVGQASLQPSFRRVNDLRADLRDGERYTLGTTLDRRVTERLSARLTGFVSRFDAISPAYSTSSRGIGVIASWDRPEATWVAGANLSSLEADERIFLYPERREDQTKSVSLSAVVKPLSALGFAPRIEVVHTHADSTVGIYDYRRTAVEFGLQRVF